VRSAAIGLFLLLGCAGRHAPADLVLVGSVYTMDPDHPRAEALAIADATIIAVGTRENVLRHRGNRTRVIELGARMILPGFHDSHVHPVTGGIELGQCDLNGLASIDAVLEKIARCHREQRGEWLVGGGWDLTLFDDASPDRALLDAIVGERPVYLTAADSHSAWVSSEALRRAGIDRTTPDPERGRIERDAAGEASGTLREAAMALVRDLMPKLDAEDHVEGLRRGLALANSFGITSFQEANGDAPVLAAYATLAARGELTARVVVAQHVDPKRGPEQLATLAERRDAIHHARLRATSIKLFADGVIEGRTAALLEPYLGTTSRGEPTYDEDRLLAFVREAERLQFDVHVHAIGDRAIRMALDAFEAAGSRARRHVIAHLQLVDPQDIARFAALGVIANFQPLWAYPDDYITELTIPVLGPERSRWLYPIRSVLDTGATVVAGSDWSVSSMNPLDAIEVAITRRAPGAAKGPPWIAEETVGLHEMLVAYTIAGAYLGRQEHATGSLVTGKRADVVVLDRDLFAIPTTQLHATRVELTLLDGAVVHGSIDRCESDVRQPAFGAHDTQHSAARRRNLGPHGLRLR
jgi:predicted amidohydrolase YtcJ